MGFGRAPELGDSIVVAGLEGAPAILEYALQQHAVALSLRKPETFCQPACAENHITRH